MAEAPLYSQGETVYIKESAALGFLEAYIVDTITHLPTGVIHYELISSLAPPAANMTMGDRNIGRRKLPVTFIESDLITYCDALDLAISNTQVQLSTLQALQDAAGCIDAGTGTET